MGVLNFISCKKTNQKNSCMISALYISYIRLPVLKILASVPATGKTHIGQPLVCVCVCKDVAKEKAEGSEVKANWTVRNARVYPLQP